MEMFDWIAQYDSIHGDGTAHEAKLAQSQSASQMDMS